MTLYILGNGFDLAHKLPTAYWDFRTYLMLGYVKAGKDADGRDTYEINEDEAAIVRRIYGEYLAGVSIHRICRGLEADGIPTKLGKKRWAYSVVESILHNEKYTGNAILGKTYKPDVLTKYRKKNNEFCITLLKKQS